MNKMTNEQCAYIAGIIDGEGCISFSKNSQTEHSYTIVFRVAITHLGILKWLQKTTGLGIIGKACVVEGWERKNIKPMYHWQFSSDGLRELLPLVIPYLIIKKEVAILGLEWLSRYGRKKLSGRYLTDEDRRWKYETYVKIRDLNRRGKALPNNGTSK